MLMLDVLEIRNSEILKNNPNMIIRLSISEMKSLASDISLNSNLMESFAATKQPFYGLLLLWHETKNINFLYEIFENERFRMFGMELIVDEPRYGRIL